jgi:hypothetical protein
LDEAIACWRRAIRLDPKNAAARSNLTKAERLTAARDKLPTYQNGTYTPASNQERLDLAEWRHMKKLRLTETRLYIDAFTADPTLADDLKAGHRYNAACNAALAAAGKGEDAGKLDDKDRARLHKQALDWLRADLALYTKLTASGPPAARPFVDKAALAKLPAEERAAFTRLWADVAALLKRAETPEKKEGQR